MVHVCSKSANSGVLRQSACMLEGTASFHPQCALLCMPLCPATGNTSMLCLCRRSCCGCLQKQWPTERYSELLLLAVYLWQYTRGRLRTKLCCAWHHVSSRRGIAVCRVCQPKSRQDREACVFGQGPAPPNNEKERGAGDWQLYQSPAAVLKEVAARNAQARLPGPPARPQACSPAPQSCCSS